MRNPINVLKVFGISFIITFLWICGLFLWKVINEKEECWENTVDCLLNISYTDFFGALFGMLLSAYALMLLFAVVAIPIRIYTNAYCNQHPDTDSEIEIETENS